MPTNRDIIARNERERKKRKRKKKNKKLAKKRDRNFVKLLQDQQILYLAECDDRVALQLIKEYKKEEFNYPLVDDLEAIWEDQTLEKDQKYYLAIIRIFSPERYQARRRESLKGKFAESTVGLNEKSCYIIETLITTTQGRLPYRIWPYWEKINEMTLPTHFDYWDQKFAEGSDEYFFRASAGSIFQKPLQNHILKTAENVGVKPVSVEGAPPVAVSGQVTNQAAVSTPPLNKTNDRKHKGITVIAKGGNINIIKRNLDKLPKSILSVLSAKGVKIVAVKDSVTEYLTHLKGVHPRGWPLGKTWDNVAGAHDSGVVVIATSGKFPTSTFNMPLHEIGHGYDYAKGYLSRESSFKEVSSSILPGSKYFSQGGNAGLSEKFAESFSHYYGGYAKISPKASSYWRNNE